MAVLHTFVEMGLDPDWGYDDVQLARVGDSFRLFQLPDLITMDKNQAKELCAALKELLND